MIPSSRVLNTVVAVWRPTETTDVDDWNQAIAGDPVLLGGVTASVQPRTLEELAAQHEGGPIIAEYVVYMRAGTATALDVRGSDYIVDDEAVYELTSDPKDQAGRGQVVSLDAERVTP